MSKPLPVPEKRLELVDEPPGSDPYNQTNATPPVPVDELPTLSPADMRLLSETIKGSRTWTPPKKTEANRRLAALCSDLEHVLAELAVLAEPIGPKVADHMARLSDAARHLEDAIDCPTLPENSEGGA